MTTTIRNFFSTAAAGAAALATISFRTRIGFDLRLRRSFKRPLSWRPPAPIQALGMVAGLLAAQIPLAAQVAPLPKVDVTFAFMADPHVSFNGYNDYEWYWGSYVDVSNPGPTLSTITWASAMIESEAANNGCKSAGQGDLCNLVQEVRKLNALSNTANTWPNGMAIGPIAGVVVGGDMTDCGGGGEAPSVNINGYNNCADYHSGLNGAQFGAFLKLFDRAHPVSPAISLDTLPFLAGLTNPDGDLPLKYPIFPGFGNHDLNFADSSQVQNYVGQWSPGARIPGVSISNSDPASKSYSWDWGGLHLVNAGVFAGSDDDDYNYSTSSLQWLESDLQAYAGDGRPVIIFQHFGFDPTWGLPWYEGSGRIHGLQGLFDAIKNYNVVGLFTGHNHGSLYNYQYPSATYQDVNNNWQPSDSNGVWHPTPTSVWPDWLGSVPQSQNVPVLPLTVYDIFHPGAAYKQNFAVVHVTNDQLEVMYADNSDDFNDATKQITFKYDFKKPLAPTPYVSSPPVPSTQLLPAPTVVQVNNQSFLVTAGYGAFKVAQFNSNGTNTLTDEQLALLMGLPVTFNNPQLTTAPDGSIFATDGQNVAMLSLVNGKLKLNWQQSLSVKADQIMGFTLQNQTYLLGYRAADAMAVFYKVNNSEGANPHLSTELSTKMDQVRDPILNIPLGFLTAQFISYPENDASADPAAPARFLRYDPLGGNMEFYAFNVSNGVAKLSTPVSENTWAPRATLIQPFQDQNGNTEFLVVSNACAQGSTAIPAIGPNGLPTVQIPTYCSPESPIMVRKLLPGYVSTEVAWRGNPSTLGPVQLLVGDGSAMGAAAFLHYDSNGGAVLGIAGSNIVYNFTLPVN
jgi:cytolysin (calcineurin-like family phosphatase)